MIKAEFRLIKSLYNRDADEFVARFDIEETPDIGQTVNINGHPYIVHEKGWAYSDQSTVNYCYIDLITINLK